MFMNLSSCIEQQHDWDSILGKNRAHLTASISENGQRLSFTAPPEYFQRHKYMLNPMKLLYDREKEVPDFKTKQKEAFASR